MEALGTTDEDFARGLLNQLVDAGKNVDEAEANFLLSIVKGVGPKDQIESMLAAQMAAIHLATMTMARRLARADNEFGLELLEPAVNRLARTFAAQVETLKRYRTGWQQKVTVEHVTVNAGGQAIVGNVEAKESATKSEAKTGPLLSESGGAFEMDRLATKQKTPIPRENSDGRKPQAKH